VKFTPLVTAIAGFIERTVMDISGPRKDEVREQLRARLVDDIKKEDLAAIETIWRECAANSEKVEQAEYDRQHADLLRRLVCNTPTNRKEIAAGIIRNWISEDRRDFFNRLARSLLDPRTCKSINGSCWTHCWTLSSFLLAFVLIGVANRIMIPLIAQSQSGMELAWQQYPAS